MGGAVTFPAAGRSAVVTGGRGAIGTAVRRALASGGDRVVGLDVVAGADDAGPTWPCDVSDEAAVAAAFAAVERHQGPVQVLVHAAGIVGAGGVEEEPPEVWRRILEVNLTSAYLCVRAALPQLRRVGSGAVVLVASVNGRFGGSALSGPAYAASKGGLITLARFLAREHGPDDITVIAVAPGPHESPMWAGLDEQRRARILALQPGGRGPGDPVDLAATIAFLCSPHARYITGATIDVNGGQWMG